MCVVHIMFICWHIHSLCITPAYISFTYSSHTHVHIIVYRPNLRTMQLLKLAFLKRGKKISHTFTYAEDVKRLVRALRLKPGLLTHLKKVY